MDSVVVLFNRLPEMEGLILEAGLNGLKAVGFAIQEQAAENIRANEQIDTGAMLNALYTETPEKSTREEAVSAALAASKSPGQHSKHPSDAKVADVGALLESHQVRVADAMEHGVYQEMGTSRGHPPRPYLLPAAEKVKEHAGEIVGAYIKEVAG